MIIHCDIDDSKQNHSLVIDLQFNNILLRRRNYGRFALKNPLIYYSQIMAHHYLTRFLHILT